MTAIFTGPGAGLARSSATVLGSTGLLGSGSTGRAGENLAVNAATGNLVISRQDEFLSGPSHDVSISRTYNSLAEVHDGDNGDKWQMGTVRKVYGLTGTLNAAGSTVRRQAGDGSVVIYNWGTRNGVAAYWTTDGDGAHDKLVNASGQWTWTDGASQFTEVYEAISGDVWRIYSYRDNNGASLAFTYHGGTQLYRVTAASGEFVQYNWSGQQITSIDTGLYDRTVTRTSYAYDGQGRLSTVSVDLIPDTVGEWYARNYTIGYEYGANGLVSAVTQTDGSRTDIAYDANGRVQTLTERASASETRVTTFAYGASYTDVTAPNGQTTRLEYAGGNGTIGAVGAWDSGGVTKEFAGSIDGEPATKYTSAAGVDWSAACWGLYAAAGQTYKFTASLKAVDGHSTDQTLGLYGGATGWGSAAQSSARIISGPGQIQHWGPNDGGLWRVTGLSSTEATRIEIIRTFTVGEGGGAYMYIDHPNGFRDGQQLIIAGASLEALAATPVFAAPAMDWYIGGVDRVYGGTVGGAPAALLTSSAGANWSSLYVGFSARAGETLKLSLNLQAVAGHATEQQLGLYGDISGWPGSGPNGSHARIVSGPGSLSQNVGGNWVVSGLSASQATQIEIVRTYDRDETGGAYIHVDHQYGVRDGQQLLVSAPVVSKFTDYPAVDRQLSRIIAPPAYAGAAQQVQTFEYDSDGNLIKSTAPNGAVTNYSYDAMGNVTLIDNPVGADIYRYYDARNDVTLEQSHGSDENYSAVAFYTSYAYSSTGQLRFRVSPDGKVTEYWYDGYGRVSYSFEYTGQRYDWGPWTDEASMVNWRDSLADKTKRHATSYTYDGRGNLSYTYDYAAAYANGDAAWEDGYSLTWYGYDHLGRLLSTNSHDQGSETYIYDGLNRVIGSSDASGAVTSVFFDDASTRTVMHLASGLNRTLTYNKSGDLISQVESAVGATTANLIPDQAHWGLFNSTSSVASPIAGIPANRYAVGAAGQGGIYSYITAVNAGETVRWRFTLKGDGTTSMHEFGIYATAEGWGTNSQDMQAVIVSGPGRLSQIGGAIWQVAGVSTSQETVIELVRTFGAAQTAAPHFYIGGTNGAAAGVGVILSALSVTRTVSDGNLAISATTSNAYDKLGRLRVSYDQFDGNNHTYFLYDNAGRKTAEINDSRSLTEFVYDANNRVIATYKNANGIDPGYLATLQDPNNTLTIAQLRPPGHSYDLRQWTIYDAGGRVVQTIDGSGFVTAYEYDGQNRVVRTTVYAINISTAGFSTSPPTSPVGVSTNAAIDSVTRTFYDRDGNVRGTLDGEGYLVEYAYDAAGNRIEEIRYPQAPGLYLGPTASFNSLVAYAAPASPDVRRTRFVYDLQGSLRYKVDAQNQVTGYVYSWYSKRLIQTVEYVNPISVPNYSFATVKAAVVGHPADRVTNLTLDKAARVTTSVDAAGTATYYTYDSAGNVAKVRHGSNAATEQITRNWYDARGNLRFSVDPAGYLRKYFYTVGGRLTAEYLYDAAVGVTDSTTITEVAALATGAYTEKNTWYDIVGRVAREFDGTGAFKLYEYYATGQLSVAYDGYDSASGTTDRSTAVMVYDQAGRLRYEYGAYGESEGIYCYFAYDAVGNRTQANDGRGVASHASYDRRGLLKTETNGASGVTTYTRNAFGEVTYVTDARGNGAVANTYDTLGRLVQAADYVAATTYTYNRFGELASTTRAGATTSFAYDKMGRVTQITDALGFFETFTYNEVGDRTSRVGKSNTVDHVAGGTTTYTYDRRGLKISETLPMSSVNAGGGVVAWAVTNTFAYDSRGNLVTETRAAGLPEQTVTQHEYDRANRLIHTVDQTFHGITPHTYYAYDARGNLTRKTDPNGYRTVYFYDDLDRVSVEINAAGTYTGYIYDPNGNVLDIRVYATPVAVPADGGSQEEAPAPSGDFRQTTFAYDNLNRMATSSVHGVYTGSFNGTSWIGSGDPLTTSYEYDANGNVVKTTDPNGNTTWAYYDVLNRKWSQVDSGGYRTDWTYDANGNVLQEVRYWNAVGTPTSITSPPPVTPGGTLDRSTGYIYDLMGNRTAEVRHYVLTHDGAGGHYHSHVQISYAYNGLGQVTQKTEQTGEAVAYTYDQAGRLTQESKTAFIDYYSGIWVTPTVQYAYDGLGNLTRTRQVGAGDAADRYTTYFYDGGKLRSMTDAEGNDGSGADGKTTYYWYDAAGNLQYEYYTRYDSNGGYAEGKTYDSTYRVYDGLGRVTQQWFTAYTSSGWNGTGPVTTTSYNAYGEVASVQVGAGALQQNQYDKGGRLVGSTVGDGVWKYFGYDRNGNQTVALTPSVDNLVGHTVASLLPYVGESNVNGTYTTYNARNLATQVIEEGRELSSSNVQTLTSTRGYNAFGELYYEFAANGARIDYTYNNMGRLIRIESPNVDVVGENGSTSYGVRPTEHMYYDLGGRLVAQRDANGGLTRYTLLANSGYGGSQALIREEYHADGGTKSITYDVHGDARMLIDEMGRYTYQYFDQMGRLAVINHGASGLLDTYEYDGLGQQLRHYNNVLGSANAEVTDYDIQGRVISQRAFGGDTTTTSYTWYDSISGVGGWHQVATNLASGRQQVEQTNVFGRVGYKSDLGGHVFTYQYDAAGRLSALVHEGWTIEYFQYFNIGKLKSIAVPYTGGSAPTTTYGYDVMGNLTSQSTYDAAYGQTQSLTATYDALGRMVTWNEAGNATTPAASGQIFYDAKGNLRRVYTVHAMLDGHGYASASGYVQDLWYRYDNMDRVVVSKGVLSGGTIVRGTAGQEIYYNLAGQRTQVWTTKTATDTVTMFDPAYPWNQWQVAVSYTADVREDYTYDGAGRLYQVLSAQSTFDGYGYAMYYGSVSPQYFVYAPGGGSLVGQFNYDAMGRLTLQQDGAAFSRSLAYDSAGRVYIDDSTTIRSNGQVYRNYTVTTYAGGWNYGDAASSTYTTTFLNYSDGAAPDTSTTNSYVWWDSALQNAMTYYPGTGAAYTTSYTYNAFAQLTSVYVGDGRPRTVTFKNSADGQAIRRDEADNNGSLGDPHDVYYRMGGRQLGMIGNNGTDNVSYVEATDQRTVVPGTGAFRSGLGYGSSIADFGLDYDALNSFDQGSGAGLYKVQAGDTLRGIAQNLWGDATLWYKLAEANGLSGASDLQAGRSLTIPTGVQRVHNNASTMKPYDPAEALGDLSPASPASKSAKKNKCGAFGMILLAVVAVAAAIALPALIPALGPSMLGGGILGGAVSGAIGGAVGSAVSQGLGLATGIQEKFSFKGVALAALGGAIGGGLKGFGDLAQAGKITGGFGKAGQFLSKGTFGADVVNGALRSTLTQGIALATGLQDKFSWAGVAAAGVAAGVGGEVTRGLGSESEFVTTLVSSSAGLIASAATRSAIEGTSFGDNIMAGLPDVIGQAVGGALGRAASSAIARARESRSAPVQQPQARMDARPTTEQTATAGEQVANAIEVIVVRAPKRSMGASFINAGLGILPERDVHQTERASITSYERAEYELARHRELFEEYGMKENGFDILVGLERLRLRFALEDGARGIDEFIPGELFDKAREMLDDWTKDSSLDEKAINTAAYLSILAIDGPGDAPTFDLWNPLDWGFDRAAYPAEVRFYRYWQGRFDRAAAETYLEIGDIGGLQERAVKRYIRATNESYDIALGLQADGELDRRYGSMAESFRLGFHTDLLARADMNRWLYGLGIDPAIDPNIGVNARVYDPADDSNYRIPDLRVGDYAIEGTLWKKDLLTPQINDILSWSNPRTVVIVNPYQHNDGRVSRLYP